MAQQPNFINLQCHRQKVLLCVYRQFIPGREALRTIVRDAASVDEQLSALLDEIDTGRSLFDWGDDPSFFSAEYLQGNAGCAGWGVCRPNVRRLLDSGDVVIFFCARRASRIEDIEYLFAGFGTIDRAVDRQVIWTDRSFRAYRKHFNVLARPGNDGRLEQYERFPPGHPDWAKRAESPYLIFDPSASRFKMHSDAAIASAKQGEKHETWAATHRATQLRRVLFSDLGVERGLRVSAIGSSHPHINLTDKLATAGIRPANLLTKLERLL